MLLILLFRSKFRAKAGVRGCVRVRPVYVVSRDVRGSVICEIMDCEDTSLPNQLTLPVPWYARLTSCEQLTLVTEESASQKLNAENT